MSNRASRRAERPRDVTDPLLWQLALDVLAAHESDEEGACRNLLCAGQPWPCAARSSAEQSLRLARRADETPPTAAPQRPDAATSTGRVPERASAPRQTRTTGSLSTATASAA
ncbi:hypothetical protein ACFYPH_17020 [Micromonospora sp. NPDC005252]|uniref:hypothetical protein n=1 Tax=Micromonospora sp. NPDC005252 TaxID=3364228 RepID=UPI0036C3F662